MTATAGGYWGRFERFFELTDPSMIFVSSSELEAAKQTVAAYRGCGDVAGAELAALKRARRVVDSVLHPETQTPIFLPFRFSAFLPMNLVTLLGMLHPSQQTPLRSMLWQWANQTYNVGMNYCNGSASGAMEPTKLLGVYAVAVASSCGTAYALNSWRQQLGPRCPAAIGVLIPFVSVALANIANVVCTRSPDILTGVTVYDEGSGEALPRPSPAAGRIAVAQVAVSRVLVPVPLMILPPWIMMALTSPHSRVGILARRPHLHLYAQIGVILVLLRFALPMCIAVFPQEAHLSASALEPELREWRNSRGEPVSRVTFNKGL